MESLVLTNCQFKHFCLLRWCRFYNHFDWRQDVGHAWKNVHATAKNVWTAKVFFRKLRERIQCTGSFSKTVKVFTHSSAALLWYTQDKNTFVFLHASAVSRASVPCLSTATNIWHLRRRESRNVEQTKAIRTYRKENVKEAVKRSEKGNRCEHQMLMDLGKQMLKNLSLSSWESFLEHCNLVPRNKGFY